MKDVTGYAHPDYAASLSEFGTPRLLPRSGGWVLERRIPGYQERDAIGCYPLFVCQYWSQLSADLDDNGGDLVSLALVTDPFGEYEVSHLRRCFPDLVVPFKQHFVVDLGRPLDKIVNSHHRRNAGKALREVSVEVCANPLDFLFDWIGLYKTLTERRNIRGIAGFSRDSFSKQLRVPGMVAFRAEKNDATVGMLLWYAQANRAYYHLGAYSARGYELRASFALFSYSIEYFARQGFEWLNLGAGAGAGTSAESGLSRFKQGWSTGVRTAYFCGRVFDKKKYREIVCEKNVPSTDYFPAYRSGEFN